jgi:hypothetical protein
MEPDKTPKMRVDINKVSMVGDIGLHDEVTITVKGKVTSIRGPEQYVGTEYVGKNETPKKVDRTYPGSLEVEIQGMKIATVNQFDAMDEDED